MTRQYLACEFTEGGRRYTYHHDGEPLSIGDKVIVETRDGEVTITVAGIIDVPPQFETKPIKGLAPVIPDVIDESEGDAAA